MPHGSETGENLKNSARSVGLPPRPFLYTLDQIATILSVSISSIEKKYIYFEGRSIGHKVKDEMIARDISPHGSRPEWRVAEQELIRWMRYKGFRYYERSRTSE